MAFHVAMLLAERLETRVSMHEPQRRLGEMEQGEGLINPVCGSITHTG
jgi:hypothetical protein